MENHPSLRVGGPREPGREQSQYQPSFCPLPSSQPERRLMTRGPPLAFWGIALRGWSRAPGTAGGPRRLAGSQRAFWSQQGCLLDPGRKRSRSHTRPRWGPRGPGRPPTPNRDSSSGHPTRCYACALPSLSPAPSQTIFETGSYSVPQWTSNLQ